MSSEQYYGFGNPDMKSDNKEKNEKVIFEIEGKIERKTSTEILLIGTLFLLILAETFLIYIILLNIKILSDICTSFLWSSIIITLYILFYFLISYIQYMQSEDYEKNNIKKLKITENRISVNTNRDNIYIYFIR